MKVLHVVSTEQRRGAEVFASDLCRSLEALGVEQRIAVLHGSDMPLVAFDAPVRELSSWRRLPGVRMDPGTLTDLRSIVRTWHPDLVQAHGGEALKYCVGAVPRGHVSIVYRRIGAAPRWLRGGPRRSVYSWLMRRTSRVVAVADAVRQESIKSFRIPESQIVTIPNGVDARRIRPSLNRESTRAALGLKPSDLVVLSIGALTWEKDPLAQIEVASRVTSQVPDSHLLMVGDGPMRKSVERAIQERNLGDRVRALGSRDDVGDLLHASDVLLMASRPDGMEGMPAVLIEAGMAGLPVVAYLVAGVDEVIVNGKTGLLFEHGDVQGLGDGVCRLLCDKGLRARFGRNGRQRCAERFGIEPIAQQYLSVYRDLTEQR